MGGRQLKSFKTSFTSGELMPALRARVDLKHYYTGAERLRNVNILPQGGVTRRPGLRHIDETQFQIARRDLTTNNQITPHTSATSVSGTASASSEYGAGYEAWRAFDGIAWNGFTGAWIAATAGTEWLQYEFASAKTINGYSIASASGWASRAPNAWTLYGSNTGAFAGEETTLDSETGQTAWSAGGETRTFSIGSPASFKYYRLIVTAINGGGFVMISEVTMNAGSGATVTAPNGGTAGNGYDNNPATLITTTNNLSTTTPYVVVHVDLGSAVAIRFADVQNLFLSGGTVNQIELEFRIQYSADNSTWVDFGEPFATVAKTATAPAVYQRRGDPSGDAVSARYWRVARVGSTDGDTNKVNIGEFQLWTETAELSKARLIRFEYDDDNKFILVATDGNIAVYQNDVRVADVQIPHASADLAQLRWAQSLNTLLLFHRQYQPYKLLRVGIPGQNANWNGSYQAFANIPDYTFNTTTAAEDIMSATRGWPACGAFFEGRLYLAGFAQAPASLVASKAADFFDLNIGTGADDDGFLITLDTDAANAIVNLYPGRNLSVFTTNAEFYLLPDVDPITPATVVAKRSTEVGSLGPGVPVVAVEGAIMYLQKGGVALREFIYTYTETAYQSNNISLLAAHLFNTPVDMALRRSQAIDEGDMVALVNTDGTLMVLQTLRSQNITGFSLHKTNGTFEAVGYETEFYFVVRRTINGTVKQFLEVWDDEHLMDCSTRSTTGLPTSTVTGLARFNGATIATRADETNLSNEAVSGGSLTLDQAATNSYEVGLAFPDVSDDGSGWQVYIKDEPVEIPGLPDGTMRFNKKRIYRPGLSLLDTQYASIRANGGAIQTVPLSTATPPAAVSGDYAEKMVMLGFSETAQIEIGQTVTGPFTCLALFKEVSG
jgi:hypothetical protein